MTTNTTTIHALNFKTERDLLLINIFSALLIAVIAFFPNSPARIILGLPFILFFPGYILICALFPRRKDLDIIERLALSMGLSIAVTSLMGLMLNYTPFGIRLYPVMLSLFLFMLLMSAVAVYRRRNIPPRGVFAPLTSISISGWFGGIKNEFIKSRNENRVIKITAIIAFIFVILALTIIARTPPASGYELSIYDAYPWYFWVLIVSVFLLVISITLYRIFFTTTSIDSNWLYVWLPVLLAYFILFLLPFFRGYPAYGRGDTLTHIGYIKDILATGGVLGNGYPISHILVAILGYITAIDINIFVITLPALFTILYIIWVSKLSSIIFKEKAMVLLVTIFSLFLMYERVQQFCPFNASLFFLPFFLYVFYKRKGSLSYTIIFVILLLLLPFLHIFFSITLIIALLALWFSDRAWEKLSGLKIKSRFFDFLSDSNITKRDYEAAIVLLSVAAGWWAIHSYLSAIGHILSWVLYSAGETPVIYKNLNALAAADLTTYQTIRVFWTRMGNVLFFYFLPVILLIVFFFLSRYRNLRSKIDKNVFQFVVIYLSFFLLSILFLFAKDYFNYGRIYRFVIISSIIISTMLIWRLINNLSYKSKKAVFVAMLLILCFLMVSNIFTVHRSPINSYANSQVSSMELNGARWCFDNFEEGRTVKIRRNTLAIFRFHDAICGRSSSSPFHYNREPIPDEFGYEGNETIADSFDISTNEKLNVYMFFTLMDKIYHKIFFKDLWSRAKSYSDENVEKLNDDYTANKLYSNGECTIWLIQNLSFKKKALPKK